MDFYDHVQDKTHLSVVNTVNTRTEILSKPYTGMKKILMWRASFHKHSYLCEIRDVPHELGAGAVIKTSVELPITTIPVALVDGAFAIVVIDMATGGIMDPRIDVLVCVEMITVIPLELIGLPGAPTKLHLLTGVSLDAVADMLIDTPAGILTVGMTDVLPSIGVGKLPDIDLWSVFGAAITTSEFTLTVSIEE